MWGIFQSRQGNTDQGNEGSIMTNLEIIQRLDLIANGLELAPLAFEALQAAAMRVIDTSPEAERGDMIDAFTWNRFE